MKTYLLYGAKDIRLSEKPVPIPGDDQVLIKPKFTGICGSDVHYFQHGYCGNFIPKRPFVLGHEFAGVVDSIGANVIGLKVGDEVAEQFEFKEKWGARWHVDLKASNEAQLRNVGISQIEISEYCTIENNDLFFSHRKEKGVTGRMLAIIGFR